MIEFVFVFLLDSHLCQVYYLELIINHILQTEYYVKVMSDMLLEVFTFYVFRSNCTPLVGIIFNCSLCFIFLQTIQMHR